MNCSADMLQEYLDHELSEQEAAEVREHLSSCRSCRRGLSEMRLLWADLGHCEDVEMPSAVCLFRQEAIYQALKKPSETPEQPTIRDPEEWDFWISQKIAWQPLTRAAGMIPGVDLLENSARSLAADLPRTALKTAGFLVRSYSKNRRRW